MVSSGCDGWETTSLRRVPGRFGLCRAGAWVKKASLGASYQIPQRILIG